MKVLLAVDPEIPVPPRFYGGIERIAAFLVDELLGRGVAVTLLAHSESQAKVRLRPWPGRRSQNGWDFLRNSLHLANVVRRDGPFDVIHNFARLGYLLSLLPRRMIKIQSYQRHVTPRSVRWGARLGGGSICFTALSRFIADRARVGSERWEIIYNGVVLEKYPFRESVAPDAPLVFLGRLDRIKGAHHAIEVARRTGRRLILAGNHAENGPEGEYFRTEIAPRLDGDRIRYVGPVDDPQKSELLGEAAALLFPVEWDEPFGIVMAEAMACGTPVLAPRRGAVPEVVEHGVTGWIGLKPEELDAGVARLPTLSRKKCRQAVETRFASGVIAEQYLRLYEDLLRAGQSA